MKKFLHILDDNGNFTGYSAAKLITIALGLGVAYYGFFGAQGKSLVSSSTFMSEEDKEIAYSWRKIYEDNRDQVEENSLNTVYLGENKDKIILGKTTVAEVLELGDYEVIDNLDKSPMSARIESSENGSIITLSYFAIDDVDSETEMFDPEVLVVNGIDVYNVIANPRMPIEYNGLSYSTSVDEMISRFGKESVVRDISARTDITGKMGEDITIDYIYFYGETSDKDNVSLKIYKDLGKAIRAGK